MSDQLSESQLAHAFGVMVVVLSAVLLALAAYIQVMP
jgi:hypothetical protein